MRTGRNLKSSVRIWSGSLDHWDMRTGRNRLDVDDGRHSSLDHWDMRTGRNTAIIARSGA